MAVDPAGRMPAVLPDRRGWSIEHAGSAVVTSDRRIAREKTSGPVLPVLRWSEGDAMMAAVNGVEHGLTCGAWTGNLSTVHRTAARVEAGYA